MAGVRDGLEAGDRDGLAALLAPAECARFDPGQRGGRLCENVTLIPEKGEGHVLLCPLGDACYVLPPYCTSDAELALAYEVVGRFLDGARAPGRGVHGGVLDDA